jgi:DNA-binding NarL/FixJ family response regulator
MRVLVVDDHEVVWNGIRAPLEHAANQVCGEQPLIECRRSVEEAVQITARAFNLILLDYHLPGLSGLAALSRMREAFESSPVVFFSGDTDARRVREAISHGASGYIPKSTTERETREALAQVLTTGVFLPPLLEFEVIPQTSTEACLPHDAIEPFLRVEFSPRQREVFARALRGMPNKIIARELGIAEGTVKVHLAMAFRALGVRNRTEAMYRVMMANAQGALAPL